MQNIDVLFEPVRIGPVMAFTAATPMINPAAVILALGLLGPQLTAAYVALGLLLLCVVGSGGWRTRWRKSFLLLGLVLWGFALYFGIQRHEWGEVLFNGQLL